MKLAKLSILTTLSALGLFLSPPFALAGGNTSRLAENFSRSEISTTGDITAPLIFYDNTVSVPASNNVLLVSISASSDLSAASGAPYTALLLNCQVDGTACASASGASQEAPDGWTNLNNYPGTESSVNYTWCTPVGRKDAAKGNAKLEHEVTLSMASSDGTDAVSLEALHVSIDAVKVKDSSNTCTGIGFVAQ
jgi:hypothetical protein